MKIAILAGGSGTRLWPLSRGHRPKQFLDLAMSGQSLLQETVARIHPLVSGRDILVVTGETFAPEVARQLPDVPPANILTEPCGRGSAPAIALAAMTIHKRWGNEVMVSLHSDHHVANHTVLCRALAAAAQMAKRGYLVTLGIPPTYPHTGLGHIKRGGLADTINGFPIYAIARFIEKPRYRTAKKYTESGEYCWNTGMFVWQPETILGEIQTYMPTLWNRLAPLHDSLDTAEGKAALDRVWPTLDVEQIDYGVMQKTKKGAVVAVANMGWNDVGDWNSLREMHVADANGNVVIGSEFAGTDASGCVVHGTGRHLIAAVGLKDVVIVETDDAILVCSRHHAQDVRRLVDQLKANGKKAYL